MLLFVIALPWHFSSQNNSQSNHSSTQVSSKIQSLLINHSIVQKDDSWPNALNRIVRKIAHLIEYVFLGIIMCTVLNFILKKTGLSAAISIIAFPFLAYLDEYHQQFVAGRTPRFFDVGMDIGGAFVGIILISIIFYTCRYVSKLKEKISELEDALK